MKFTPGYWMIISIIPWIISNQALTHPPQDELPKSAPLWMHLVLICATSSGQGSRTQVRTPLGLPLFQASRSKWPLLLVAVALLGRLIGRQDLVVWRAVTTGHAHT